MLWFHKQEFKFFGASPLFFWALQLLSALAWGIIFCSTLPSCVVSTCHTLVIIVGISITSLMATPYQAMWRQCRLNQCIWTSKGAGLASQTKVKRIRWPRNTRRAGHGYTGKHQRLVRKVRECRCQLHWSTQHACVRQNHTGCTPSIPVSNQNKHA